MARLRHGVPGGWLGHSAMERPATRRLAALMAADVVGYSARMAAAETATLEDLADLRAILERRVEEGGGRLFAVAGDGFLVEFASPVAAVRAAFEIQRDLAARRRR